MRGEVMIVFCCRICGIAILPERVEAGTCESGECARLLAEARRPPRARRLSADEFQAKLRARAGNPAGGYRGRAS